MYISTGRVLFSWRAAEDPLKFFEDAPKAVPNAVLKLFVDLFATAETAALFYSNDNKVLIDILVRQLSDLSAGDAVSVTALWLWRRLRISSNSISHSCAAPTWSCAVASCATPTTRTTSTARAT